MKKSAVILRACGIRKVFRTGKEKLEVLREVNLEVAYGEMVAIMGASGVGKSTLLHILGTLDRPTQGELAIDGENVLELEDEDLAHFRNEHIGFVFQFHHLLPEFTALENVVLPAMMAAGRRQGAEAEAVELLHSVGLEQRLHHRPGELSGGECQRVAMARALVMKPKVVLADEPSGNLDTAASASLHALMRTLAQRYGQAFVVMTHDRALAGGMDRIGYIDSGVLHID